MIHAIFTCLESRQCSYVIEPSFQDKGRWYVRPVL